MALRIEQAHSAEHLVMPGWDEPFTVALPDEIQALRDRALALHAEYGTQALTNSELTLAEARAWSTHTQDEDWLIWRARLCAERLESMPLELEPGERLVGKPHLRALTPADRARLAEAESILASMPPFPGGDAGHFHPDYEKLFRVGLGGLRDEIRSRRAHAAGSQRAFYEACLIAIQATIAYVQRVGRDCEEMSLRDPEHGGAWLELADICLQVAMYPPATFHQAIQLMFLTQIALWFGEKHYLTAPGRMDQTLFPFYVADLAAGRITQREAFELIACLYIQMNRILQTGSAVSVLVGGRDRRGQDATNDLTYLCLAARLATRLVYPTVAIAWHENTPAELMDFATAMLARGIGDPAFFNDALIVQGLREHGVQPDDAYDYMNSTCVEIKPVGRSNIWVTQPYFNLAQSLLQVMSAIASGELAEPEGFLEFSDLVRQQIATEVRSAAERLDQVWHARSKRGCFPLASCFIADCLADGLDFDRGGARYNWVENSFVGLANLVDSLVTIRHLVYETRDLSLAELYRILADDFCGHETLRRRILALPKYGNDQDEPDELAQAWAAFLIETTESNQVGSSAYVPGLFCWIMHEKLGSQTGATPDGRAAFWPLADGAGGAQGRERQGPTASILSTTKWSHRRVLGGLVQNVKFAGDLLQSSRDRQALRGLIETYMRRGGFEIQINVVNKDVLLAARERPEAFADLLVRVAGYSDYFTKLNAKMQEEIIARTEHSF